MERNNVMNYKTDKDVVDNYKLIPLIESGKLDLLKELKWVKKGSLLTIFDEGKNITKNGNGANGNGKNGNGWNNGANNKELIEK